MSRENKYGKDRNDLLDQAYELFERTEIPFERSGDEVWEDMSARIHPGRKAGAAAVQRFSLKRSIALAASLTLLVSLGTFSRLYRVKTICPPGENMTLELPDGSVAELNGRTSLVHYPLWRPVSRRIHLEGGAFFNVKEGKRFEVHTPRGVTYVLGTTFTVLSRASSFSVTCHSGRVSVSTNSGGGSMTLQQNERAYLNSSGELELRDIKVDPYVPAWKNKFLKFAGTPLEQVFDMIGEQYGIRIETPGNLDYLYTGNLATDQSVEKIISLICRPFGLVYEKRSGSEYCIFLSSKD